MVIDIKALIASGKKGWIEKGLKEFSQVRTMFYIFISLWVSQEYVFVKNVHLRYEHFMVYKSSPNKMIFNLKITKKMKNSMTNELKKYV